MNASNDTLEIWFIRHGETDWNLERRIQGATDRELNATGRSQASRLRDRLAGVEFDSVWASDLKRASETAEIAFPGREIRLDPRLREIHAGEHEGVSVFELSPEDAALRAAMDDGDPHVAPTGGETYGEVIARVSEWLSELPTSGRVASVAHGGLVRAAMRVVLAQADGWKNGPRLSVVNTSITEVHVRPEGYTLVRLNDHAHLE